jgi:hypothetical protein
MNQGLNVVNHISLDCLTSSENLRVKRMPGFDLFIVASGRSILVLEFLDYKFKVVCRHLDICPMEIDDFEFKNSGLWIKERGSYLLTCLQFS